MEATVDIIDALAQIMSREKLSSLSLDQGHLKIKLKREHGEKQKTNPDEPSQKTSFSERTYPSQQDEDKEEEIIDPSLIEIFSPMVGVFYESSQPEGKPFISVGQSFSEGDTLCVIEAMKLMNELTAEFPGEIVEICVNNGDIVEFGQVLFRIRKGV